MSSGQRDEGVTPLFPVAQKSTEQKLSNPQPALKFSSFRPAESSRASNLAELFSSEDEDEELPNKEESQEKKRPRESSSSKPSEAETKRHKKESDADVYFDDRKGDKQNLMYEGLYRLDVPSYRRCCLTMEAMNSSKFLATFLENAICNGVCHRSSSLLTDRYFAPKFVRRERSKRLQRMTFDREGPALEACMNTDEKYIPLATAAKDNDEEEGHMILKESVEEGVLRRTRELNTQLRKNPYDLSLWMRYAEYQDEAVALTRRRVTTSSTAEKKLSILASALKYHPKSEELLCRLLQLNSIISSVAQANEKYQAMLSHVPHSLLLWRSYWSYQKSTFSDFSCEKMRGIYEGSLKGIQTGLQTRASVAIQSEKGEEDIVLAFLSGVQFDFQSGYTEKAIAKIQACLEWTFCQPGNKASLSEETLHMFFRQFWENSQFAKIGEEGARGFAAFVDSRILEPEMPPQPSTKTNTAQTTSAQDDPAESGWSGWFEINSRMEEEEAKEEAEEESEEEQPDVLDEGLENQETEVELMKELGLKLEELENVASISPKALSKLLQTERQRMEAFFLPMKPDAAEEVDVDQLVLFEELQPLLFELEHTSSKKKLLLGSLHLLGLDVSSLMCSNDSFFGGLHSWTDDVPTQFSHTLPSVFGEAYDQGRLPFYQECGPCGRFVIHLLEFFSTQLFLSDIRIRQLWLKTAIEIEDLNSGGTATAAKVGRSILQKYKEDLNLWIAYASVLFEHGNAKESTRVWKAVFANALRTAAVDPTFSVLSMVFHFFEGSVPSMMHLDLIAFLVTRDEAYLQPVLAKRDTTAAASRAILTEFCRQQCQDYFEQRLEAALLDDLSWTEYECITCYAHFQALLPFEASAAFQEPAFYSKAAQSLEQILQRLPERNISSSRQCEALHEKYCVWMSKAQMHPRDVRRSISQSLRVFPFNLSLLLLLVQAHVQAYTVSSLLADMKSHVLKYPRTETVALLMLLEEFRSLQKVNVPGLFERLVALKNGEHGSSPLFWRLYLESVAKRGGVDFKRVFLRSIRACPWSKSIWIRGLELSQGHLKGNEVVDYLETIKEKGVRWSTEAYEILLEEAAEME